MMPVDEYRAKVLEHVARMSIETVELAQAQGKVLAEDVRAPWPLPTFDNSSMDGYAVIAADVAKASPDNPVLLTVIDDIAAGSMPNTSINAGATARIMTGAPIPDGADCVVPVERTDGGTEVVVINEPVEAGAFIRLSGDDVQEGNVVLTAGSVIGARQIAVLASVGCAELPVYGTPTVAIVSTGSELVEPGTELQPGMIVDSNSYMLAAACRTAGAIPKRHKRVIDDDATLADVLFDVAEQVDLILTSGGVSMGAYDTVKAVLREQGTVDFIKVAMNPGMPQGAGYVIRRSTGDRVPIVTLPGNPVSSYISFENFVRPALRKMMGFDSLLRPTLTAICTAEMTSPPNKRQFARAQLSADSSTVTPVGGQGSHVVGGLAMANAIIVIDEDVTSVSSGTPVTVIDLREDQ